MKGTTDNLISDALRICWSCPSGVWITKTSSLLQFVHFISSSSSCSLSTLDHSLGPTQQMLSMSWQLLEFHWLFWWSYTRSKSSCYATSDGGSYTCHVTATGGQEATGSFTLRVIGMVLTVPYCKTAAVCVALWLLLVIEFTSARITPCVFRSAVNPLQNSDILKPKCCTHHRKEQMILPKCTTQQCPTHCTWSTKLVVTLIKLPKASALQAPCYRSQKFAHTFHTGLDLLSFHILYSWLLVHSCAIIILTVCDQKALKYLI